MIAPHHSTLFAVSLALMCTVASASAEPITAIYSVQVLFRQSYPTGAIERMDERFRMRLTFDPAQVSPGTGTYGPPTFSTVPLPLPSVPSDLSVTSSGFTGHVSGLPDPGTAYTQYAVARTITASGPRTDVSEREFFRLLHLESFVTDLATQPEVSAATFPAHLGITGHNSLNEFNANFAYGGYFLTGPVGPEGDYAPNSYAYHGNALLVGTETAVPEPATIFLASAGLTVAAGRRWRARRRSSEPR